jgi:hypothetical protein
MVVNRVAGHFHFALTHEEHATLMAVYKERDALNVSHTIHALSFGEAQNSIRAVNSGCAKYSIGARYSIGIRLGSSKEAMKLRIARGEDTPDLRIGRS